MYSLKSALSVFAAGVAFLTTCLPAYSQTLAEGEKAKKLWEGAYSRFQGQSWDQAKPLMEDFVKQCVDHENAPQAFMALAVCRLNTKDTPGYEAATDEVIRRFPLSHYWFIAYSSRMKQALAAKQPEQYIKLLENMLARAPEAPWSLADDIYNATLYPHYWHQDGRRYPCDPYAFMLHAYVNWDYPNWILTVPRVATTPELAKRALAALTKTFNLHKKDMPPEWQTVHVALLRQSGQEQQADKQFQDYLADWGDDPRASAFLVLMANHAQAVKDDKTADECWDTLVKKYGNFGGLGIPSYNRLSYLQQKDRFDDYLKLMPVYFKTDADQHGYRTGQAASWCIGMAQRKAATGDASRCEPAMAAVEANYGLKDHFARQRNILIWKIDLLIRQKKADEAAKLAEELISDKQWCADSYNSIKQWAAANEPFKALVESAKKKWGIPDLDPRSKAGELLEQLKTRLKNEEPRFAEEIGEEMWNNHRADAATIEAVKALIDYYFAKLTPDLRDKWIDRMISQYKSHPLTQAVLITRVQAEQAAKSYDKVAVALDTLFSRFPPTMLNNDYYGYRIGCFSAAKDSKGALEYARKNYGAWANAGDINAIHRIVDAVGNANMKGYYPDNRAVGEAWMTFGKALGDTRAGLYCTANAWNAYFWSQYYAYLYADRICMPEGKTLTDALMAQTFDPDVQWRTAYGDINYLAVSVNIKPGPAEPNKPDTNLVAAQEDAKKMLALLNQRLKTGQKIRDLSMRLDFYGVGAALGRAKMLREADELGNKLKTIIVTERDEHGLDILLGAAHAGAGDFAVAADHYLNVVHDSRWPADCYGLLNIALGWLRQARSPRVQAELERYLNSIPNIQEMIPRIIKDQYGQAAYDMLRTRYPHSQALYEMNDAIEKARHPSPTPTPAAGPKR
ncbi:MAG: hypothetical protein ACE15C_12125 [Phycisphaerae bacterium]